MASAWLWVPGSLLSFLVVKDLGIALGQGIWAGCVALVSFLWGQLYFHAGMNDPALGLLGIVCLVGGISSLGLISGGGCGGDDGAAHQGTSSAPPEPLSGRRPASPAPAASSSANTPSLKEPLVTFVADDLNVSQVRRATALIDDHVEPHAGPRRRPARPHPSPHYRAAPPFTGDYRHRHDQRRGRQRESRRYRCDACIPNCHPWVAITTARAAQLAATAHVLCMPPLMPSVRGTARQRASPGRS